MATESIFHNIVLNSPEEIENFVTAMEKAEEMKNFVKFSVVRRHCKSNLNSMKGELANLWDLLQF